MITREVLKRVRPLIRVGSALVARDDIAGIDEVAEMLGVTKRTVQRYTTRDDFPEPLGRLAVGRVWRRLDVEAWARSTLPLREGRPPKEGTNGEADEHPPSR